MPHEKVETEPGTIVHMERALQKVEHDKLHHNAKAWEENAKTKIESRYSTFNRFCCHINSLIITRVILCLSDTQLNASQSIHQNWGSGTTVTLLIYY